MIRMLTILVIILLTIPFAMAHGEEAFSAAEELIDAKTDCDQLSEEQLETIGDYYMEQMHPGEAHEMMDQMMGGDGSEQLTLMHIGIARSFYCGEHDAVSSGMMNTIMGRGSSGMMDYTFGLSKNNGGMMNGFGMGSTFGMSFLWLVNLAVGAFVVGIIFWWTRKLVLGKR